MRAWDDLFKFFVNGRKVAGIRDNTNLSGAQTALYEDQIFVSHSPSSSRSGSMRTSIFRYAPFNPISSMDNRISVPCLT